MVQIEQLIGKKMFIIKSIKVATVDYSKKDHHERIRRD